MCWVKELKYVMICEAEIQHNIRAEELRCDLQGWEMVIGTSKHKVVCGAGELRNDKMYRAKATTRLDLGQVREKDAI